MSKLEISNGDLINLRNSIRTKTLMVTDGEKGWNLIQSEKTHYAPPPGIVPVTTLGAGDAACAGLINALIRELPIADEVNNVTARALRSRFPTGFAERTTNKAIHEFTRKRHYLQIASIVITTTAYFTESCHPFHVKAATRHAAKLPPPGACFVDGGGRAIVTL